MCLYTRHKEFVHAKKQIIVNLITSLLRRVAPFVNICTFVGCGSNYGGYLFPNDAFKI